MDTLTNVWNFLANLVQQYGGTALYCLCFAAGGWLLAKILTKLAKRALSKTNRVGDIGIKIINSVIRGVIYAIVAMIVLDAFHVPVTAIVTMFSAVGLALSLAAKDTLSNFAKGFQLLITRPFKIGDYIQVDDFAGTVRSIEIIYTRIATPDNKIILIPNNQITDNVIVNFSAEEDRRLDLTFSIDYNDDAEKAKDIIAGLLASHPLALDSPAPTIRIGNHSASSIDLTVWVWVKGANYWTLSFDLKEQVKQAFDKQGIHIPYPHMDINILNPEAFKKQV